MKHNHDHHLFQAWLNVWNMRCCPPEHTLAGPSSPELEQHLALCPVCRQQREMLCSFPHAVPVQAPAAAMDRGQPAPGQLWSVDTALAGWGPRNRYFAAPVVLVIATADPNTLSVVQTCGEELLAGPDDVLLDNGLTGFAQPWNRYALKRQQLTFHLGSVTPTCLARLLAAEPHAEPAITPGSLLWFFRQMEVETGCYFASQIQAGTGTSASQQDITALPIDLELLRQLPLILPENGDNLPLDDLLAHTRPDETLLPLAAAAENAGQAQMLIFSSRKDEHPPLSVRTGMATLDPVQLEQATLPDGSQATLLSVTGATSEPVHPHAVWVLRWQCDDHLLKPLPGMSGCVQGVFWATFQVDELVNPYAGTLLIRVIEQ